MTYEEALQIAMEELYDAVEDLRFNKKGYPKRIEDQCNQLLTARNVLCKALEDAETDRLRAKKKQIYEDLKDDINEWFECTPEMHSIPMQKPTGDKPMKGLETDAFITVSDMVEHEDGSATFKIDTTTEATRLLVEMGLVSLLEKAIDENNKDYSLDPSLRKDSDEQETDN